MLIFEIATGVFIGGLMLAMALAAFQYARNVPADSDKLMPWWVYAGWIGPMIFVAAQVYLYR
jgi:uncharacterized membrane protein YdcZ (DUF606 family)